MTLGKPAIDATTEQERLTSEVADLEAQANDADKEKAVAAEAVDDLVGAVQDEIVETLQSVDSTVTKNLSKSYEESPTASLTPTTSPPAASS